MRKLIPTVATGLALALAAFGAAAQKTQLLVYTALEDEQLPVFKKAFEADVETMFGKPFRITHKTVFGILSWLIFGGLLLTHHLSGLRGRIAARWTIAGFMFLMLGYFGSKFVLEVILQRAASS